MGAFAPITVTEEDKVLARPAPAFKLMFRLGQRWFRNINDSVKEKVKKLKGLFSTSLSYYLRHPAVFIVGTIVLQFIALSQL